ncbi:hypothetical protein OC842_006723 [Tilletia horrida]|uniref:Uncharacterized protein n=1 Tax=Tilletia horrida TaxID=155126 RepID=A0AAN6G6P8_9BASI|nr:hypothetical protein OC842_006723 [Tilletia horrida]
MAEPSKKEEQEAKKKQEGEEIIATDLAARDSAKRLFSDHQNSYLGLFRIPVRADAKDLITSTYVAAQRGTRKREWAWLQKILIITGRTFELTPITVGIHPEIIHPDTMKRVKTATKSGITMLEFAKAMLTGDPDKMAEAHDKYVAPKVNPPSLTLKFHTPDENDPSNPSLRNAVHLLDGQKRIAAFRSILRHFGKDRSAPFNYIDAHVFEFRKALESNELIGQIVNKAPPVQNDSSLADQMHRIFVDWSLVFEQSVFRYPETDTAYGQRFVQADKVAEESKQKRQRGQMAVLRSLILKDRRVRASTLSAMVTPYAFDNFNVDVTGLLIKANLPDFVVFAQTLFGFQQRLMQTAYTVDKKGALNLDSMFHLTNSSMLSVLAKNPIHAKGQSRAALVAGAAALLDEKFGYEPEEGGNDFCPDPTKPPPGGHSIWAQTEFGHLRLYLLARAQILYAIYGPHTEDIPSRAWPSNAVEVGYSSSRPKPTLFPDGADARLWYNFDAGTGDEALPPEARVVKGTKLAHEAFLQAHFDAAAGSSSEAGVFTCLASSTALAEVFYHQQTKALLKDISLVLAEIGSMVDPTSMLAVASTQAATIEASATTHVGTGPRTTADDVRDSVFVPFFGALLRTVADPFPSDERTVPKDGPADVDPFLARGHASRVLGPVIMPMWEFIVHNASEMAAELNDARRQAEYVAKVQMYEHFAKAPATRFGSEEDVDFTSFYHRVQWEPQEPAKWADPAHLHTYYWARVLTARTALEKGEDPKKWTMTDVKRRSPGNTHVETLISTIFARTHLVHNSVFWHAVRVMLTNIETSCLSFSLYTKDPGGTIEALQGVGTMLKGWFGDYRLAVPMLTEFNNTHTALQPPLTFRLRDRALIAAFLPAIVPFSKVTASEQLRYMEATTMRLWEPAEDELEEVQARAQLRDKGLIPIIDDAKLTATSSFKKKRTAKKGGKRKKSSGRDGADEGDDDADDENEDGAAGNEELAEDPNAPQPVYLHPDAACLPKRSRNWLSEVRQLLSQGEGAGLGAEDDPLIPNADLTGSRLLADWHAKQGTAWMAYNFDIAQRQGVPLDADQEALASKLRVVPMLARVPNAGEESTLFSYDFPNARIWPMERIMPWEGFLMHSQSKLDLLRDIEQDAPFAPMSRAGMLSASAGYLGPMHSCRAVDYLPTLKKVQEGGVKPSAPKGAAAREAFASQQLEVIASDFAGRLARAPVKLLAEGERPSGAGEGGNGAGSATGTVQGSKVSEEDPQPTTVADRRRYKGAFCAQSVAAADDFARFVRPFMDRLQICLPTWGDEEVEEDEDADGSSDEDEVRRTVPGPNAPSAEEAITQFFAPMFQPHHWMRGTGAGMRLRASRYGSGFSPAFVWHHAWQAELDRPGSLESNRSTAGGTIAAPVTTRMGYQGGMPKAAASDFKKMVAAAKAWSEYSERGSFVKAERSMLYGYSHTVVTEPESPFYSATLNVHAQRDTLKDLTDAASKGAQGIAPTPLVYAWASAHGLMPQWMGSTLYNPKTAKLNLGQLDAGVAPETPYKLPGLDILAVLAKMKEDLGKPDFIHVNEQVAVPYPHLPASAVKKVVEERTLPSAGSSYAWDIVWRLHMRDRWAKKRTEPDWADVLPILDVDGDESDRELLPKEPWELGTKAFTEAAMDRWKQGTVLMPAPPNVEEIRAATAAARADEQAEAAAQAKRKGVETEKAKRKGKGKEKEKAPTEARDHISDSDVELADADAAAAAATTAAKKKKKKNPGVAQPESREYTPMDVSEDDADRVVGESEDGEDDEPPQTPPPRASARQPKVVEEKDEDEDESEEEEEESDDNDEERPRRSRVQLLGVRVGPDGAIIPPRNTPTPPGGGGSLAPSRPRPRPHTSGGAQSGQTSARGSVRRRAGDSDSDPSPPAPSQARQKQAPIRPRSGSPSEGNTAGPSSGPAKKIRTAKTGTAGAEAARAPIPSSSRGRGGGRGRGRGGRGSGTSGARGGK